MKIHKLNLKLLVLSFISITFLLSCENDTTDLGSGLIADNFEGNITYVDLVAYNVTNNDTIRADYTSLVKGLVGVYEDNIFGKTKASFSTQIRLNDTGLSGSIFKVDSVVLTLHPSYKSSSYTTKKVTSNDTIKSVIKYPISSYLGSTGTAMQVQVNRINTSLETVDSWFYSDKVIDVGDLLGTATLSDSLTSISLSTSSGTSILSATTPGYRIKLDADYFKTNFFDKYSSLSDNTQFVQYFKGIRITPVGDTSRFMFNFTNSTITLTAYYKYKNSSSDSYTSATYAFTMGGTANAVNGDYDFYGRSTASSLLKQQMASPNTTSGESKLYLQGMGGPSINIKLDDAQLASIKDSVQNKGWAITGAKLKFNIAEDTGTKPSYIYAYNYTVKSKLADLEGYSTLSGYYLNPAYDATNSPDYYILNVTKHVKNIVEKNGSNDEILVELGNFQVNSSSAYIGYYRTTRAYEPYRLVFYGNQADDDKKLRLEITYSKN